MSRSRRSNFTPEQISQNRKSAKSLLGNFIRNTGGSLIDTITLGATDLDKKGDSAFQTGAKNYLGNITRPIADLTKSPEQKKAETDPNQTQLGSPFDRQQYNRDFRNMLITDTALRDYEMRREKQRNLDMFRKTMPLVDIAAETAAQRRLMEDRQSPTKISQQILRARTGEAALMDAVARQGNTAVNIATAGLAPRGRAGGR